MTTSTRVGDETHRRLCMESIGPVTPTMIAPTVTPTCGASPSIESTLRLVAYRQGSGAATTETDPLQARRCRGVCLNLLNRDRTVILRVAGLRRCPSMLTTPVHDQSSRTTRATAARDPGHRWCDRTAPNPMPESPGCEVCPELWPQYGENNHCGKTDEEVLRPT